ncbi:hypothetical protein D3C72_1589440 [compost metagenome]
MARVVVLQRKGSHGRPAHETLGRCKRRVEGPQRVNGIGYRQRALAAKGGHALHTLALAGPGIAGRIRSAAAARDAQQEDRVPRGAATYPEAVADPFRQPQPAHRLPLHRAGIERAAGIDQPMAPEQPQAQPDIGRGMLYGVDRIGFVTGLQRCREGIEGTLRRQRRCSAAGGLVHRTGLVQQPLQVQHLEAQARVVAHRRG